MGLLGSVKAKGVILGGPVLVLTPPYTSSLALKQMICAHGNKSSSIKELQGKAIAFPLFLA